MPNRSDQSPNLATSDAAGRPPIFFLGDHPALDFVNTVAAPSGTQIEWIATGRDLVGWLVQAGAITDAEKTSILTKWPATKLDKVAGEAVALREWFRGVLARVKAEGMSALARTDIDHLNAVLARGATFEQVEAHTAHGRWHIVTNRPWRDPGEILGPIASAMADVLTNGDFDLIRKCENPPCTIWFYDRTKGHRRRWCSQTMCGNRAKVAAFRERQRQAE